MTKLAAALKLKPYNIPRILYSIQHSGDDNMTYDTDKESFILRIVSVPAPQVAMPLARAMLDSTRKIEQALIQKLNCMYFVARIVSLPSIETMLKKERLVDNGKEMYIEFSK